MATKIGICNQALGFIRSASIADIEEGSNEALACSTHWDSALAATLAGHPWNFAGAYKLLAASAETPPPNWDYAYAEPADLLAARFILPAVKGDTPPNFERADGLIYTDQPNAWLHYTKVVSDPVRFSALFCLALAYRLAAMIAPALTADRGWVQAAETQYQNVIREAHVADANEGFDETPSNPPWIVADGIADLLKA